MWTPWPSVGGIGCIHLSCRIHPKRATVVPRSIVWDTPVHHHYQIGINFFFIHCPNSTTWIWDCSNYMDGSYLQINGFPLHLTKWSGWPIEHLPWRITMSDVDASIGGAWRKRLNHRLFQLVSWQNSGYTYRISFNWGAHQLPTTCWWSTVCYSWLL